MNRRKALLRYEIGNAKWFFLAGMLLAGLLLISIHGILWDMITPKPWGDEAMSIGGFVSVSTAETFSSVLLEALQYTTFPAIILVGYMAAVQFSDYHNRNRREYTFSLPYTQKERFLAKLVTGYGILTVICLFFGIGVFCLRSYYYPRILRNYLIYPVYKVIMANDTWLHTLRTLVILWLIMLAAYAVYLLVNTVVVHGNLAVLTGLGIMAAPVWIRYQAMAYESIFLAPDKTGVLEDWFTHHSTTNRLVSLFLGGGYYDKYFNLDWMDSTLWDTSDVISLVSYGSTVKLIIPILVFIPLCLALAWFFHIRQDGAKFGRLVPCRPMRIVLSAGIALCVGLAVNWVIIVLCEMNQLGVALVTLAVLVAALYILTDKILAKVIR